MRKIIFLSLGAILISVTLTGCVQKQSAPDGQAFLREALAQLQEKRLEKGTVDGTVNVVLDPSSKGSGQFDVKLTTTFNGAKPEERTSSMEAELSGNLTLPQGSTGKGNLKLKARVFPEETYFYLENINLESPQRAQEVSQILMLASLYKAKWLRLPNQTPLKLEDKLPLNTGTQLTVEQQTAFKELMLKTDLLKITENLGEEKIGSYATYHYKVVLAKENIPVFAEQAALITEQTFTEEDKTRLQKQLTNLNPLGEVWIGIADKLFYKVIADSEIVSSEEGDKIGQIKANLNLDHNQPPEIQKPEKAEDFGLPFLPGMTGGE